MYTKNWSNPKKEVQRQDGVPGWKWEEATNKDGEDDGVDLSDDSLLKSRVDKSDLSLLDIESTILVRVKLFRVRMRVLRVGGGRARHVERVEGVREKGGR